MARRIVASATCVSTRATSINVMFGHVTVFFAACASCRSFTIRSDTLLRDSLPFFKSPLGSLFGEPWEQVCC